jgi:hypothetical protein
VELAALEPGVIVAGENEQSRVLGSPLQESIILLFSDPDCGLATTVKFPDWPERIVTVAGDAVKETLVGAEEVAATHVAL